MTPTSDSRRRFKPLSPAAKTRLLDQLVAMTEGGHLRPAAQTKKAERPDETADLPTDSEGDGEL